MKNIMKLPKSLQVYTYHALLFAYRKYTNKASKAKICVVILTKTSNSDARLGKAITAYRNNKSNVHFCVVESGYGNIKTKVEYYFRPPFPFHYNKFIQYALNQIDLTDYDAILISNDDVVALPGAIDRLYQSGFSSCSPVDPTVQRTLSLWRPVIGYDIEYHLCGWCLFISTKLILDLGITNLFHDRYHFYLQDVYYSKLIAAMGVVHAVVPSAKVIHLEHQSTVEAQSYVLEYESLIPHLETDLQIAVKSLVGRL